METGRITSELSLPGHARGITFDGEALWVSLKEQTKALRLDPATGTEQAAVPLPAGDGSCALAWTSQGESDALWAARCRTAALVELDPESGAERRRLDPLAGEDAECRGLCTDGAAGPTLWFLEGRGSGETASSRAGRLDTRDGEVHKRIVLPPDSEGLAWDGRWLWTARRELRRLCRIDPMFADVTLVLEVDFPPCGIAFDGSRLWSAHRDQARLVSLDWPGI